MKSERRSISVSGRLARREFLKIGGAAVGVAFSGCRTAAVSPAPKRWYKGMIHSHSYWSDGRAFPEQAINSYRRRGYDFFCLSDHNRLSWEKDEWRVVKPEPGKWPPDVEQRVYDAWRRDFPWARSRVNAKGETEARLTPYRELLERFNEPGRFLLMPGYELTRGIGRQNFNAARQVHVNCINFDELQPSARYTNLIQDVFTDHTYSNLIRESREEAELLMKAKGNPPHLIMLNHPHWLMCDCLPQDLIDNSEIRFFEICNNGCEIDPPEELQRNGGLCNDRFWDVVNAFRARAGKPLLYGVGSDDTHWYHYTDYDENLVHDGDAWIRVKADALTPAALFGAMNRGDFYAAAGLDLELVEFSAHTLRVRARPRQGETLRIRFIVTKRNFDDRIVKTVELTERFRRSVPIYSDTIGTTAKLVEDVKGGVIEGEYALADDDLYVRARVESDRLSPWYERRRQDRMCPHHAMAWTQPYANV